VEWDFQIACDLIFTKVVAIAMQAFDYAYPHGFLKC
jgi:hypothetical protein